MSAFEHFENEGWSAEDWARLNDEIQAVLLIGARVRQTLTVGSSTGGPYQVVSPRVIAPKGDKGAFTLDTSNVQKPVRLYVDFIVQSEQIGDATVLRTLAVGAAQKLAPSEDKVLLLGARAKLANGVRAKNAEDEHSLYTDVDPQQANPIELVHDAIGELESRGHAGPYVVLMMPALWLETRKRKDNVFGHDTLRRLVGADGEILPIQRSEVAPDYRGVVFARHAIGLDLVQVAPPSVSLVQYDDGDLRLRVEEQFALRVQDREAVQSIHWAP